MKSLIYNYDTSKYSRELNSLISAGEFNLAISLLVKNVEEILKDENVVGKFFYLKEFDDSIIAISEKLKSSHSKYINSTSCETNKQGLILATEIYSAGGHTNVIKDIVEIYPSTDIVLTDLFGRYQRNKWVDFTKLIPIQTTLLILGNESLVNKIIRLANHIKKYSGPVFLFNHQHDALLLIAALISENKNIHFVHHADYSPCLGCTITAFKHLDLFKEKHNKCTESLSVEPMLIPLAVKDLGLKPTKNTNIINTVTSGSFNKYSRYGDVAYKFIVEKILNSINGNHYHIGKIDNDYLMELKNYLEQCNINFNRFLYVEHVPSLWDALKKINAEIYITSAPINGGRTEIEAQGCGYPIISFKDETKPVLEYALHSDATLYYTDIEGLGLRIAECSNNIKVISESSRNFYLENFDFNFMKNKIDNIFSAPNNNDCN